MKVSVYGGLHMLAPIQTKQFVSVEYPDGPHARNGRYIAAWAIGLYIAITLALILTGICLLLGAAPLAFPVGMLAGMIGVITGQSYYDG